MTQDKRPRCGNCIFYEMATESRRLPMTAQLTAAGMRPAFESVGTHHGNCNYEPPSRDGADAAATVEDRVACHYHRDVGVEDGDDYRLEGLKEQREAEATGKSDRTPADAIAAHGDAVDRDDARRG